MDAAYQKRLLDPLISELITEFPAISLVGPRASGKTTTARQYARTIVKLDAPDTAEIFRSAPDAALRDLPEPILLDEWQEAPEVLGAVKRAVDTERRPGRFILTGSVRAELDSTTWPGTGRVIHVPMTGLTVREKLGVDKQNLPFIDRIAASGAEDLRQPAVKPDVRDYVGIALEGGFPEPALRLSNRSRQRWLNSYIQQLVTRDALSVEPRRDPQRIRRYFDALALNTAGVVDFSTLTQAAQIDRKTAMGYDRLLSNLYVIELVPAWFTNRLKRLSQHPKRYIVDPALSAASAGADVNTVLLDSDLLGRVIDTFVVAQLRAELPISDLQPRLHHLRYDGGRREVDVLIELSGRRVIAIEIKAAAIPPRSSARHLAWLRDELGDRFVHGLVLHTGQYIQELGDRITAAPISVLWA